jgi:hypothetical protein
MAVTEAQLMDGTACYRALNPDQIRALRVYGKVLSLVVEGGTDYTATLATTLLSDAAAFTKGMNAPQLDMALAFLTLRQAGSATPSVATVMTAIKCLSKADPLILKRAEVLLDAKFAFALVG